MAARLAPAFVHTVLLISVALGAAQPTLAQPATLDAPDSVIVGAPIALTWMGPDAAREFISVDEAGSAESSYGPYVYADRDQPAVLPAPDVLGQYVLRYHSGSSGYAVLSACSALYRGLRLWTAAVREAGSLDQDAVIRAPDHAKLADGLDGGCDGRSRSRAPGLPCTRVGDPLEPGMTARGWPG